MALDRAYTSVKAAGMAEVILLNRHSVAHMHQSTVPRGVCLGLT